MIFLDISAGKASCFLFISSYFVIFARK